MDLSATIAFVVVTSITPGPNNISSFVFSSAIGYRKTLNYLLGIVLGTICMMSASGLLIEVLQNYIENIGVVLKWFAAAYIIFLAYKSLTLTVSKDVDMPKEPTFFNGLILQLVNPKAIFFGITLFSTFLSELTGDPKLIVVSAMMISCVTFSSISLWAYGGSLMMKYLKNEKAVRIVGIVMALLLVYFAVTVVRTT